MTRFARILLIWMTSLFSVLSLGVLVGSIAHASEDITSPDFKLPVSELSPREDTSISEYNQWPRKNLQTFLVKVARMMLIIIPVVAVILLIVAGIMMATAAGDTEQIGKAKTIIQLNIAAVVVALLSAAIIRFVAYILW